MKSGLSAYIHVPTHVTWKMVFDKSSKALNNGQYEFNLGSQHQTDPDRPLRQLALGLGEHPLILVVPARTSARFTGKNLERGSIPHNTAQKGERTSTQAQAVSPSIWKHPVPIHTHHSCPYTRKRSTGSHCSCSFVRNWDYSTMLKWFGIEEHIALSYLMVCYLMHSDNTSHFRLTISTILI